MLVDLEEPETVLLIQLLNLHVIEEQRGNLDESAGAFTAKVLQKIMRVRHEWLLSKS